MNKKLNLLIIVIMVFSVILTACGGGQADAKKVCAVLDTGGENDKSFNEFTLKGAREAADAAGLEFTHIVSEATSDYEKNINNFVDEGCGLIITVGFLMGDATAAAARANPDVKFAIVDVEYFPGGGCDESVDSCYTEEGGLSNVTSLMFAEDEVGYLAGVLAACMTDQPSHQGGLGQPLSWPRIHIRSKTCRFGQIIPSGYSG